jgi:hypothetical protein
MLLPTVRHRIEIPNRETALECLGDFGARVGPRIGPNKRTHDQKEDYSIRHMICGLLNSKALPIPTIIEMLEPDPEGAWPDALLRWADGSISGMEITEATSPDYQQQLTLEERIADREPEKIVFFNAKSDGRASKPAFGIADCVSAAIELKGDARLTQGKYSGTPVCDLLIYENAEDGLFLESRDRKAVSEVVTAIHFGGRGLSTRFIDSFRHVHLLTGPHLVYSILRSPRIYQTERVKDSMDAMQ